MKSLESRRLQKQQRKGADGRQTQITVQEHLLLDLTWRSAGNNNKSQLACASSTDPTHGDGLSY